MSEHLPGLDFNRQIITPATREDLPGGAIAIYVDDDFWCVALLPYEQYVTRTIEQIVAEMWPQYVAGASYRPDHGTPEQAAYYERVEEENRQIRAEYTEQEIHRLRHDVSRLKEGRTDVMPRSVTRLEMNANYLMREYEHLLVALAHEEKPREDKPGICSICGLYGSDRIHHPEWIARKAAGHSPDIEWQGAYGDDRSVVVPKDGTKDSAPA